MLLRTALGQLSDLVLQSVDLDFQSLQLRSYHRLLIRDCHMSSSPSHKPKRWSVSTASATFRHAPKCVLRENTTSCTSCWVGTRWARPEPPRFSVIHIRSQPLRTSRHRLATRWATSSLLGSDFPPRVCNARSRRLGGARLSESRGLSVNLSPPAGSEWDAEAQCLAERTTLALWKPFACVSPATSPF